MSKGVYKNSVEHKYSYNAVQYKVPAYGWSSTSRHIGVWFINPTIEYLSGGASKQELDCHFGDNGNPDPIILDYWRGTHYGGGASCNIAAGENWSKVVGPIFVYVNSLSSFKTPSPADLATLAATAGNPTIPPAWKDNQTALWQNALAQAKAEKAKWPYDWVNGVDYPHKDQRGNVTGQLVLNDPQAASTKLPHLTVGLAHPDYAGGGGGGFGRGGFGRGGLPPGAGTPAGAPLAGPAPGNGPPAGAGGRFGASGGFGRGGGNGIVDWTHDAKFYQFWNDGSEDGKFTITNVRPGTYTLHAFADGVLGEFAQANITVAPGQALDLGKLEWKPVRYGKQVWEIGYPDRTGGKFYKGDGDDYWLWGWNLRYALLFPNDITYTVGKSDYHKDWFFEEVPHATNLPCQSRGERPRQPALRLGQGRVARPVPADQHARAVGHLRSGPGDHLDDQVQHGQSRAWAGDPARVPGRSRRQRRIGGGGQRPKRRHHPDHRHQCPPLQYEQKRLARIQPAVRRRAAEAGRK